MTLSGEGSYPTSYLVNRLKLTRVGVTTSGNHDATELTTQLKFNCQKP